MPPLQVIQRTPDPGQAQQPQSDPIQTLQAIQAIKLKRRALDIQAQQTENTVEQMKFQKQGRALDFLLKAKELNANPEMVMKSLTELFGKDIAVQTLGTMGETIMNASGSSSDKLKSAQADMMSKAFSGEGDGGLIFTGMSGSSPSFENPEARARIVAAETKAREKAKLEAQLEPVQNSYNIYNNILDSAINEIGGVSENALAAWAKGTLSSFEAEVGSLPNVQAANKILDSASITIASFINRGRPTEPDAKAVQKAMPRITYPAATNEALRKFLNSVLSTGSETIGPGNEVMQYGAATLVDKAEDLAKRVYEAGGTEAEVDAALRKYYELALPNAISQVGGQ